MADPADPPRAIPAVTVEKHGNAIVAALNVKLLDDQSLKLLRQVIDQALEDQTISPLVIDLSRVELLPSLGLGIIVKLAGKCTSANRTLKLAALRPQVRQVFSITRLDGLLNLTDTVEAALA
jgi:anti-sigma B factor antagonist